MQSRVVSHGLNQFLLGKVEDWGQLPEALGMQVDQSGLLSGTWNERVGLRGLHTYRSVYDDPHDSSQYHYEYYTELYAILDPPLRIGVRVDKAGLLQRASASVFGASDAQLGHAEFDRAFRVSVRDHELLTRMLSPLDANAMVAFAASEPRFWFSDRYVTIEHPKYERDLGTCRRGLEKVGRAAELLLAARERAAASWEREFHRAWGQVAAGWGLEYQPRVCRIEGMVRGVRVAASLSDDGTHTTLSFVSSVPWGCSLSLAVQGGDGFFAKLFRGQDIVVGDAAFDAAFIVKGEPEARVRELLTPAARRAILEAFRGYADLEVEDQRVRLELPRRVHDAHELDEALKRCFRVAETLLPQSTGAGPFR